MNLREPLHIRHAIPAWDDQSQRGALMLRKRFAVEGPRQEWFIRHRLLARETPSELLVEFVFLSSKLDFLLSVIGAKENELARSGFYTDGIKNGFKRNARPAAISGETLQGTSIARALKACDEFRGSHFFQLVDRQ